MVFFLLEGALPNSSADLWVEGASFLLFTSAAVVSAIILVKVGRPPPLVSSAAAGVNARQKFVAGMLVANTLRVVALVLHLVLQEESNGVIFPSLRVTLLRHVSNLQIVWLDDVLMLSPSLAFLSSFSAVVLLWAKVHATTKMVNLPYADCLFVGVNVCFYVVAVAIAVSTLVVKSYFSLWVYISCVIGFLDTTVALSMLYYGVLLSMELAKTAKRKFPGKWIIFRTVTLSIVCPVLLLIHGAVWLTWDATLGRPPLLVVLLLSLSGEWLPAAFILVLLFSGARESHPSPEVSLDFSTDSDNNESLLPNETQAMPNLHGASNLKWKQIYPQPA
jgi:hypothetical protein